MLYYEFGQGAYHFLVAFGLACAFLVAFKWLYQISTPYDEKQMIASGNAAAGITLGGAILGFALPLASALTQTTSIVEFALWAALAGVIQIVASLVLRRIVVRDLVSRLQDNNVATASYIAATSIALGLLNAASMTY